MELLVYRLVYPFLWIISRLPWTLFYLLCDLVYYFVYYIISYRKKTVTDNLFLVFPEKSKKEIFKIRKAFYKHMCDMFLEMIKTMGISKEEMIKRFKIVEPETYKNLEANQKSIMVLMGHYASYEWAIAAHEVVDFPIIGVYKKIKNKHFDSLVHRIRARFDAKLIQASKAMQEITKHKNHGKLYSYGFVADQSPKLTNSYYWTDFMDIKVPAFLGGEVLAKRLDMAVAYLQVKKVGRGYYEAKFIPITENAKNCEDYFITKTYLKMLEKQIREEPQYYLWTHKRWKHRNSPIPEGATVD